MKIKNILLMLVVAGFSASCFVSCDGGGGGSDGGIKIEIPDDENAANSEQTRSGADSSGADTSLEASYGVQVYDGINSERLKVGLSALARDSQMDSLAAEHNADMISRANPFSELLADHANAQSRVDVVTARGFTGYGENTGAIRGYSSSVVASTMVTGWVTSPGHFKNIIGDYSTTGVAVTVDPRDGAIYATQIFAR